MEESTMARQDIDQGIVMKTAVRLYYGSDAIHTLALVGSRSGLFNKLNHYVFRSSTVSHVLYPGLRACRNLLLKVMGKTKINGPLQMQIISLDYNSYVGKIGVGRINRGRIRTGIERKSTSPNSSH